MKQRYKPTTQFSTLWFKSFSFLCIVCGFLDRLLFALAYVPGLCLFTAFIGLISGVIQGVSMGFYQLYRLYYCFANKQIQSNKGYPKCIFIIMYIFGIIVGINAFLSFLFIPKGAFINTDCGIDTNLNSYKHPWTISHFEYAPCWIGITYICYSAWDLVTLCLYINKLRWLIGSTVNKAIIFILFKITILTLFYQIMASSGVAIMLFTKHYFVENSLPSLIAFNCMISISKLSLSISMYLMMDHNWKHYRLFLKVISQIKLHWICCKWRYILIDQLDELDTRLLYEVHGDEIESDMDKYYQTLDKTNIDNPTILCSETVYIEKYDHMNSLEHLDISFIDEPSSAINTNSGSCIAYPIGVSCN